MGLIRRCAVLVLLLVAGAISVSAQLGPGPGTPTHVICDSGCAGGGGGTVTQGPGGASPWLVNFGGTAQPVTFNGIAQPVSFTMPSLVAGAAIIGKVGIDQTTPGTTNGVVVNNSSLAVTNAGLSNLDVELSTRLKPADTLTGVTTVGTVTTITNPVAATQSGTWTDRIADGAGNGLTTNSTTYSSKFGLDANLLGVLGTAFTSAGFVDIKGADGNVFVRQTSGANLHVNVDSAPSTAVTCANCSGTVTVGGSVTANAGTNLNTSLLAVEAGGNLATVATNTTPLVTAGGGGYVRQDSTATIAKESGGNLATIATQDTTTATNTTTLAGAIGTRAAMAPAAYMAVAGADLSGSLVPLATLGGAQQVIVMTSGPAALRLRCNGLRRTNCQ